jgi:phosphatidate cytidylyltransferase
MSNLLQRIIVAAIGIPLVLFVVLTKPLALFGLILLLTGLAAHEYYGLARTKGYRPLIFVGTTLATLIASTFGRLRMLSLVKTDDNGLALPSYELTAVLLIAGMLVIMIAELFRNFPKPTENMATTLFGAIYTGIGIGSVYGIYEFFTSMNVDKEMFDVIPPGYFIAVMLAAIWISDSAAYFAGRAWGKKKLYERVSPGKTWVGAIAGLVTALVCWLITPNLFYEFTLFTNVELLIFGLITGVIGPIGDLAESLIKRDVGVKDSSTLIPGHGGILDRLDSIMFVAPTILLYLEVIGIG